MSEATASEGEPGRATGDGGPNVRQRLYVFLAVLVLVVLIIFAIAFL